jgi:predicted O-linked N-acetylglucosamine transferase (SPINDLY family)
VVSVAEAFAVAWQYHRAGDFQQAEQVYRRILQAHPSEAPVWCHLGAACQALGKLDQAVASYQQAVRLEPGYAEAHNNLGVALTEQGRLGEAVASCEQALRLRPGFAEAHYNRGNALRRQGRADEAAADYRRALVLNPHYADAHNNLGIILAQQGRREEAEASYRRALALWPAYAEAHNNLGTVLQEQGRVDEAVHSYEQALRLNPGEAESHGNLANALMNQGRVAEAVASCRRALRLRPDLASAHSNLLFCLTHDPQADPESVFAEHRRWADQHARGAAGPPHDNGRDPERRLRVGYVSPDFRGHALAYFFEPILAHHDPRQVEAVCYAEVPFPDAMTARLRSLAHAWRSTCGLSDAAVAGLVRDDRIDILVDLAGHTANHRLRAFAHTPAPVQVTYLGYPNTTGLTAIAYRLTDAVADPPGEPVRHTEELVRLPAGFRSYAPPGDAPAVTPLPARKAGHVTFGSFHNLAKLNAGVLDLWCRVLHAIPSARLVVFRHTLTGGTRDYFDRQFTDRGVVGERVDLRHTAPAGGSYLSVFGDIDISLDALPYSGHTTACESLWMGVPFLTLCGTSHAGRMAASALTQAGMTDFIATTPAEFVALAVRLAGDLDRLAGLRARLRNRMRDSPLCDGKAFTRDLEQAYRRMWRRWCAGPGG